jgi:hypothetical protein
VSRKQLGHELKNSRNMETEMGKQLETIGKQKWENIWKHIRETRNGKEMVCRSMFEELAEFAVFRQRLYLGLYAYNFHSCLIKY